MQPKIQIQNINHTNQTSNMKNLTLAALTNNWKLAQPKTNLKTPDNANGSKFTINATTEDTITITTTGNTLITIKFAAFHEALHFLATGNYTEKNPCQISANININSAGEFCKATRKANGSNVMISSYIAPILAHMKLTAINGKRPNTTWLI